MEIFTWNKNFSTWNQYNQRIILGITAIMVIYYLSYFYGFHWNFHACTSLIRSHSKILFMFFFSGDKHTVQFEYVSVFSGGDSFWTWILLTLVFLIAPLEICSLKWFFFELLHEAICELWCPVFGIWMN